VRAGRLDCPCHPTSFGSNGSLPFSQLADQPVLSPRTAVSAEGDQVQVFLPDASTA
jgi:hypothetical protein